MGDFDSSLPIVTIEAPGVSSEHICIAGWESVGSNVVKMKVDTNGQIFVTGVDLDIRDLDNAADNILIYGYDGIANQPIKTNNSGQLEVVVISGGGGGYQYQDNVANTSAYGNVIVGDDGTNLQFIKVNTVGNLEVDIALQSLTAFKISKDANVNAENNPIFVKTVDFVSGIEIHDYDTVIDVAKGAVSDHDYVITPGKTFVLRKVAGSASGAIKVEVMIGPSTVLVSKAVKFSSSANLNADIVFDPPIEIVQSGGSDPEIVRVRRTNRDRQTMDIYSTISGSEV